MIPKKHVDILKTALRMMGSESDALGPRNLAQAVQQCATQHGVNLSGEAVGAVVSEALSDDPNSEARQELWRYLLQWDHLKADWCEGTAPNTKERRTRVYQLLDFGKDIRERCDRLMRPRLDADVATVIARDHEEWYTAARKKEHSFYWNAYSAYLRRVRHWPPESLDQLDRSSDLILQHLSDPTRTAIFQTKGLVVGYVQSGKTASFTAVTAKAADAGYRLIIVLAGTLDILRNQTQRRVDKELVGKEQLRSYTAEGVEHDYARDGEWSEFIEHGALPSKKGAFDWHRLTGPQFDYHSLGKGLSALEFEVIQPDRSLLDPANLHPCKARLIVIKKHPRILKRLIADLRGLEHTHLPEVPTLVIDDESDQASINTERPTSPERTATNKQIRALLKTLERAQYVGYTATPFANVFLDAADPADLFPKDYIIALKKSDGYMGVTDFFDLPEDSGPNERSFVRDVRGEDEDAPNLPKALDCFILAGAIKLYRQSKDSRLRFKHHTMLVHRSHQMKDHDLDADIVRQVFDRGNFGTEAALPRLEREYAEFLDVSRTQKESGTPDMPAFEEIVPFIKLCSDKVRKCPVSVVNGDKKHAEEAPDFDKEPVWRILVGGTKLSRGYTVEGLTTSYYRRRAKNADTLMQMGRWFGFRQGFRDLVRLFLGRAEPDGPKRTFDLVEAFKSICKDEEEFRAQLEKYSRLGGERITPAQVPPLVPAHLLLPTSPQKMWNAVLTSQNLGEEWVERTLAPTKRTDIGRNSDLAAEMLGGANCDSGEFAIKKNGSEWKSKAHVAVVEAGAVLRFLTSYAWSKPHSWEAVLEFIRGRMGDPGFDRWLVVAPQLEDGNATPWKGLSKPVFRAVTRARIDEAPKRFKAYTEPRHRKIMEHLLGLNPGVAATPFTKQYAVEKHAGLLLYPCLDPRETEISIGFALLFPKNNIQKQLVFRARDPENADAITVDETRVNAGPKRRSRK